MTLHEFIHMHDSVACSYKKKPSSILFWLVNTFSCCGQLYYLYDYHQLFFQLSEIELSENMIII